MMAAPAQASPGDEQVEDHSVLFLPVMMNFEPKHAQVSYALRLTNTGSGSAQRLDVYVAIPQPVYNQQIRSLVFESGYTLLADQYGQAVAHFTFEELGPGETALITWQAEVLLGPVDFGLDPAVVTGLEQIPPDIRTQYTTDGAMYRLDSPVIQAAAVEAAGGATDLYWLAWNIHDFVANRLEYVADGEWSDAETVFEQQHGTCSEYTFLFIALCRANGLPARYAGATMQRGEGTSIDTSFHRWAEIYLPPYGWVPVDVQADDGGSLSHDRFGALSDRGFVTTIGGGASSFLNWNYHDRYTYSASGAVNIERERIFTWVVP
jgi:hypothetical protein